MSRQQNGFSDNDVSKHNNTVKQNLKRGDLVEFHRGAYSHWAVYIGNGQIVHLAGDDNDGLNANVKPEHLFTISGKTFNKAKVCLEALENVILDSKIFINNSKDNSWQAFHPDDIVNKAVSKIGEVGYSVITKNCEHFAKFCRYGVEQSDQVDNLKTGLAVGGAILATVGIIGTVIHKSKQNEKKARSNSR